MQLLNSRNHYGLVAVLLHWGMAVLILGLFFLGEYMVDLDYYDAWYQSAPNLHRSIGIIVGLFLIFRLAWRLSNLRPASTAPRWEQLIAMWIQRIFYVLILLIVISGYLITTADGQAVSVFNWFDIPAVFDSYDNQEDIAGEIHEWLSHIFIILFVLHASAALKHHFINRDSTLLHMLGRDESQKTKSTTHPKR